MIFATTGEYHLHHRMLANTKQIEIMETFGMDPPHGPLEPKLTASPKPCEELYLHVGGALCEEDGRGDEDNRADGEGDQKMIKSGKSRDQSVWSQVQNEADLEPMIHPNP